ncbi:undecaprenyl-diphosphate phosphatase [Kitasatospora cineracea]|uniref:undecaprenyl-diphosphate phosphatase n=1 Tax=Kitasatospora cineracea TaxID=88074 RepID=UPI0033E8832F
MSPPLAYPESIGIGLLQGVTELFPVSSLGHAVLVPALIGGRTRHDLDVTADGSPYPAVLVGHFRRDWIRIVGGLFSSPTRREIATPEQKLARLLVLPTVPVGTAGPALDHLLRDALGKPNPAAFFLALNGPVLYTAERLKRGGTGRLAGRLPGRLRLRPLPHQRTSRPAASPPSPPPAPWPASAARST